MCLLLQYYRPKDICFFVLFHRWIGQSSGSLVFASMIYNNMKKHNFSKDLISAVKAAARKEEISKYGKLISFKTKIYKNKKKYKRKEKYGFKSDF